MRRFVHFFLTAAVVASVCTAAVTVDDVKSTPDGWQPAAPREEVRPQFAYLPNGGRDGKGGLVIAADDRDGLDGYWAKTFAVTGGKHYRFFALRKAEGMAWSRRSAVPRIVWQDDNGKQVPRDTPVVTDYLKGMVAMAEPEYPTDKVTDAGGWTEVSDTYRAPLKAARAVVELHLRWAPRGRVEWSSVAFAETAPPAERRVRLAAVHFRPQGGKTPADNCRQFAPLIAEAARQRADLVVLPETLTYYGLGRQFVYVVGVGDTVTARDVNTAVPVLGRRQPYLDADACGGGSRTGRPWIPGSDEQLDDANVIQCNGRVRGRR